MAYAPRQERRHAPAVPMEKVIDPAGWLPEELAANNEWIYELSEPECHQIVDAINVIEKRGLDLKKSRKMIFNLMVLRMRCPIFVMNFRMGEGLY